MLLIGSRALQYQTKKLCDASIGGLKRRILDTDYICTYEDYKKNIDKLKGDNSVKIHTIWPTSPTSLVVKFVHKSNPEEMKIIEFCIAYPNTSNAMILDYCTDVRERVNSKERAAPINVLLMLKLSHRYRKDSPHFLKTMKDIHFMRDNFPKEQLEFDDRLKEILKVREQETYKKQNKPKLNQGKDSFFQKDESFYVWDHDDIHKAVATLDKPAYLYFKPEDSEVMTSKKMWLECSEDIKLRAGLEESYTLALERSIIPAPGVLTPKQAFDKALEKVCTSITSGWFREYCWEHYYEIQALYNEDFVTKFEQVKEKGQIKPFKR